MTDRPLPEAVEEAIREYGEAVAADARIVPPIMDPVASIIAPLDALRAAIAAAIEAALKAECEACAEVASRTFDATKRESVECAQRCAAAIRARGGA